MSTTVTTLEEALLSPETRPQVIADTADLVDAEVQSKSGVSGMAIKAGYAAVKKWKPIIVHEALDNLLDRFVRKLEPFHTEWVEKGKPGTFEAEINADKNRVANALLAVTDERAQEIEAGLVRKTYEKLRPMGERHVEAAVPGLARIVQKYLP